MNFNPLSEFKYKLFKYNCDIRKMIRQKLELMRLIFFLPFEHHYYNCLSLTCYTLVPLSQSKLLRTGIIVSVWHAIYWYNCLSLTFYILVPLSPSDMLRTGIIVTVWHALYWYHCHGLRWYRLHGTIVTVSHATYRYNCHSLACYVLV